MKGKNIAQKQNFKQLYFVESDSVNTNHCVCVCVCVCVGGGGGGYILGGTKLHKIIVSESKTSNFLEIVQQTHYQSLKPKSY